MRTKPRERIGKLAGEEEEKVPTEFMPKGVAFGAIFDITPGLDGKSWPRLQIVVGTSAWTITAPVDAFEKFIQSVSEGGEGVIKTVRRAEMGLTVASEMPRNRQERRHPSAWRP